MVASYNVSNVVLFCYTGDVFARDLTYPEGEKTHWLVSDSVFTWLVSCSLILLSLATTHYHSSDTQLHHVAKLFCANLRHCMLARTYTHCILVKLALCFKQTLVATFHKRIVLLETSLSFLTVFYILAKLTSSPMHLYLSQPLCLSCVSLFSTLCM